MLQALTGLLVTAQPQRLRAPQTARFTFLCFAAVGLLTLGWASLRAWDFHYDRPGVVNIELSSDQSQVQLERIASLLGVSTRQPTPAMADAIVDRLPSHVWRMPVVQREAFGLALDQVPASKRFSVVVRSIPSSANSVAFSDDILAVMRRHGWQAQSIRDLDVNAKLTGIAVAVSPMVKSNAQVPLNAKRLIVMLQKAGISPYGAPQPGLTPPQFELVIGSGPQ